MSVPLDLVQGNIVKPFGRSRAVYLFLQFRKDAEQPWPLLQSILKPVVISASDQDSITPKRNADGSRPASPRGVGIFGLSYAGYAYFGREQEFPYDETLGSNRFKAGLKKSAEKNSGEYLWAPPPVTSWEPGYQQDIHAFLLLADDDAERLATTAQGVQDALMDIASVITQECAHKIRPSGKAYDVEPFGFREGVAKVEEPETVFTKEPGGGWGCYAAYLKLEQNLTKFHAASEDIAAEARQGGAKATGPDVQALALGRHPDGDPLVPKGPGGQDDFSFHGVSERACPMHAHIRTMNPRNGEPTFKILRRGMPYGAATGESPAGSGSGLLFLSFQLSILDFLGLLIRSRARLDPILAQAPRQVGAAVAAPPAPAQRWAFEAQRSSSLGALSATVQTTYSMTDLTAMKGGEYFYIPSMTFLGLK